MNLCLFGKIIDVVDQINWFGIDGFLLLFGVISLYIWFLKVTLCGIDSVYVTGM